MKVEAQVHLNKFIPRDYQRPILDAFFKDKYKRLMIILPRRAGKDVVAFNILIRAALRSPGVYFLVYPTYSQGRKILWDSVLSNGQRFLDFIPSELITNTNSTEMKIRLVNDSLIQVVGSDNCDSLVGTNPRGCVFSEYAISDPRAYQYIRPALTNNDGWAIFITTPRGKNHAWELYNIAVNNPDDWFAYKLSVEDTHHIPLEAIEKERLSGEMSDDLIQQEYYCSFEMGVEGAFYSKYIDQMKLNGRIGQVPWESGAKVNVAFDIGVRDSTCLIFYQVIGQTVRIIDCYEKQKEGLEHYIKVINSKPYVYGKFFAPADVSVVEWGSGMSRIEKARQLGLRFETKVVNNRTISALPNVSVIDGIESVRSAFSKIWIDEVRCAPLIKALENYRQEYDIKKRIYNSQPLHDWSSHFADAMRYLALSLGKMQEGLTHKDIEQSRMRALYGDNANMPAIFRNLEELPPYQ